MELLDRRISDEVQRAFDRFVREHQIPPELQHDIARTMQLSGKAAANPKLKQHERRPKRPRFLQLSVRLMGKPMGNSISHHAK
jgi:hypothetical protein